MAKEYIDREEALSAIKQTFEKGEGPSLYIKSIPAANVSPVQRGEWIGVDTSYWRWYHDTARTVFSKSFRCSECGRKTIIREKFCPSCGAKMDKEKA